MKNITILFSVLVVLLFTSCEKEDPIDIGPFEFVPEYIDTTTVLGRKIYEIDQKYESKIIPNWSLDFIGSGALAVPPYAQKVLPFLSFMEEIWFEPYGDVEFLRKNLPREIVLVGGTINYGEGSGSDFGAAGLADSQYRIVIGQVNDYDPENFTKDEYLDYRIEMERVLHHEFSHILCRKHGLPDKYKEISKGLYLKNTHYSSLDLEEALNRGFIRPYGASNELEDWATLVEIVVAYSEESVMNKLFAVYNPDTDDYDKFVGLAAYDKLQKKYQIICSFYEKLGIDIKALGKASQEKREKLIDEIVNP